MTTDLANGWSLNPDGDGDWTDWGADHLAKASVLAVGDGYTIVVVRAEAGYTGTPHEHAHTEFGYILSGTVRNQRQTMIPGGAYVAERGTTHDDFEALTAATYLTIFKL